MRIVTLACRECGTVVAANELEANRRMKCPGVACEAVLEFEQIPEEDREYFLNHRHEYDV